MKTQKTTSTSTAASTSTAIRAPKALGENQEIVSGSLPMTWSETRLLGRTVHTAVVEASVGGIGELHLFTLSVYDDDPAVRGMHSVVKARLEASEMPEPFSAGSLESAKTAAGVIAVREGYDASITTTRDILDADTIAALRADEAVEGVEYDSESGAVTVHLAPSYWLGDRTSFTSKSVEWALFVVKERVSWFEQ